MREYRVLNVSKGYLEPIASRYKKPYDIRAGRRGFKKDDLVKFVENETNNFIFARIHTILRSWEVPDEWGWDNLGDFEVLTFSTMWIGVKPDFKVKEIE